MATSVKQRHENDCNDTLNCKKIVTSVSDVQELSDFLEWCEINNFKISSKVRVGSEGSCAQFGMIAVEDIAEGYCLFQIPRKCLLMPENSSINSLIEKEKDSLAARNQWIPLLITLLYEKNNPSSKWKPYLDIFPNTESLDLPIFWESSQVNELLKGTGVDAAVERDLKMIQNDFEKLVVPFVEKHSDQFRNHKPDLEEFKKMVAFVMAYSFTEPHAKADKISDDGSRDESSEESDGENDQTSMAPPMMVPLADSLNHITDHNAKLTFGKEALKMVAARNIKKGEEIFNTYGEVSNLHLMHMYGFAELYPANRNDVVEIPVVRMLEASQELSPDHKLTSDKWNFLKEQDIISEDDVFVINKEGFVTDDICLQTLKVLALNDEEFKDYAEKEGWSDAESDTSGTEDSKLAFANLQNLDSRWKQILLRTAQLHRSQYNLNSEENEKQLQQVTDLRSRQRFSLYTRHGQHKLLQMLIDACK